MSSVRIGSAFTSAQGTFDQRYLKLDASNDPLTGTLDLVNTDAQGQALITPINSATTQINWARVNKTGSTLADFGATTSAELAGVISDETGSGALVFANSPVFTTPNIGTASGVGSNLTVARISGSTYSTVQHLQDIFHSSGWISGGTIADNGDGTASVAAGTGLIRATDSSVAQIVFFDWAQDTSVTLTDNSINFIYVRYNAGSPDIVAATSRPSDYQTNVVLGSVYREGTTLHIYSDEKDTVGDHAKQMIRMNRAVMPFARESGAVISETGTRNIALTAGAFWEGLTRFTTAAFDSSGVDTFSYFYRDGGSGWAEVTAQTQIDNTQYDDGDGGLGTLTASRYGVHWVYLESDGDVGVVYGQGDYALAQAEAAQPLSSIPPRLSNTGRLVGKIIIQKSSATFFLIESPFTSEFTLAGVTDHGDLSGLSDDDHTQYLLASGTRALAGAWDMGSQALTNVNIDSGIIEGVTSFNKVAITAPATSATLTIADGKTVTANVSPTFSGADMTFTGSGSATYTYPLASDTLVGRDSTDTLTNKTLTSPVLTTPSLGAATATSIVLDSGGLYLEDLGGTYRHQHIPNETNTATRVLYWKLNNANRNIDLSGDLTLANNLITSGNFALTLTTTGTTGVTLPTTGTLATLAGTEELDSKTLDSSVGKGTWTASGTWTLPAITLGGVATLAENSAIALDPAGSADEKWSGITVTGTAGATLAVGDLIYLDVTAGEWLLADADAAATAGPVPLGICILASTDGQPTNILLHGTVRSAAFPSSIALGAPVFVDVTAGDITATKPSGTDDVVRVLGWAVTTEPNTIYFNPSSDYDTVV